MLKPVRKLLKMALRNHIFTFLFLLTVLVMFVAGYKLFFSNKKTYVYARVKVGQGYWWASTQKPSMWFVEGVQKARDEKNLLGDSIAHVVDIRYYPYYGGNQFDIYLIVKLKVSKIGETGKYSFKRSTIGISTPIDFEFPLVQFSGTITDLSEKPIRDEFVQKEILLTKKGTYPWEYDSILIGDTMSDGKRTIFEVLDKQASDTISQSYDNEGNFLPSITEQRKYVSVRAKITLRKEGGYLVFGGEQVVLKGKTLGVSTKNFIFNDFIVADIK